MNIVTVRPMMKSDVQEVLTIEELCFPIPWSKKAFLIELESNKCAAYFVAEIGDSLVGYGGMWLMIDEAHVTNIAVHPDFRKQGVGISILTAMIEKAKMQNSLRMTLEVRKSNFPAIKLYTRFGFKTEGIRKGYYSDNNEDALILWCSI